MTFFSPASSYSRGMYSSPSGPNWSVVWSLTVGSALITDFGVVFGGGEDCVGVTLVICDGNAAVCDCGV